MTKKKAVTILVGNGLGMAIDDKHFDLKRTMQIQWDKLKKELGHSSEWVNFSRVIKILLNNKEFPCNENELFKLHSIFMSFYNIKELLKETPELKECLTNNEDFIQLTDCYYRYLEKISNHFYHYEPPTNGLFPKFIEFFQERIRLNKVNGLVTNLFTLNYDRLLYKPFIEKEILYKFKNKTYFVDGFAYTKELSLNDKKLIFNQENLIPKYRSDIGWYVHLHGSPLFYSQSSDNSEMLDVVFKESSHDFFKTIKNTESKQRKRNHIVLCHPKQKESQIHFSYILDIYFDLFYSSIINSEIILIFGYGGEDQHINKALRKHKDAKICIVERKDESGDRLKYWKNILGTSIDDDLRLHLINDKKSILEYDFKKGLS